MMDEYFNMETFGVREQSKDYLSEGDQKAIYFLNKSIRKIEDGFECGLIWKEDFSEFPKTCCMAYKRLLTTERKMKADADFSKRYCEKIEEYIAKDYVRKLEKSEANITTSKTFYLPHFGVINPNKPGIRIVFDAAAKIHGMSFNDALVTGPDLNKPLLETLMKFREAKVAVVGDIKEMFLHIKIPKEDEQSHRFLWRNGNTSQDVDIYVMQRVMFGATCSPTIAQFVKNYNAENFREQYPRAVEGIVNRHYVDDYVDSFKTEEEAVEVIGDVIRIHKHGGFELRKIQSNSHKVMHLYGDGELMDNINVEKKDNRILGMYWSVKSDTFTFVLKLNKVDPEILTLKKRPKWPTGGQKMVRRYRTIPKLELQAAVMGVRLKNKIIAAHTIMIRKVVFWSDSSAVIMWIKSDHRQYKQFVANRVSEILDSSNVEQWRWISGKDNPADEATRFKNGFQYKADGKWKNGPGFLCLNENLWPKQTFNEDLNENTEELRIKFVCVVNKSFPAITTDINRFSSYRRLKRSMAFVFRYISNLKKRCKKEELIYGELSAEEEMRAETYNSRQDAKVTMLIVQYYHQKLHHINRATIISEIRQKFWVVSVRVALNKVESRCQFCKNRRSQAVQPQMAPLPADRVTPYVRPFSYCGVDLFGPCYVTIRRSREKRWVAVFTCLTVRAIHLEIVANTSTDSFLLALRNFMNRRGVPVQIRSDNGTNFVGINKELHHDSTFIDFNSVTEKLGPLGIKWIFNTPMNPSAGGAWERLIQSVKKVMAHIVTEKAPQLETFRSLLIEAENIVNSRPLTHLPITIDDPQPLTPNHFLLGCCNSTQTPSPFYPQNLCLRKQWKILKSLKDCWWRRWIREYLPDLIRRAKWCSPKTTINIGSLVYLIDADVSRSNWRLGRIVRLFPSKDGIVRSAEVRTSAGILRRPLSKLAIIETE
ncbi:uncharacterized protein LOC142224934 [Haematobia irritans]|uniref:uncharacterized protein LOC142224934 n=1 Tax=Haematobia irritans TaxID=7368 RepID=UPI003F508E79